ncbi:hypothetical protein [Pseudomonas sp. CCOS 191]|uniref:hypothetical protein n=1 Tax=Pseudomonas sp. CCOS 191 TaxID=1649877 RepID=UPI000624ED29|nr:hypothetical protein [Pseudomonas sp. CCOS 191]CRI54626.1 hypothetical protein CCOS191_0090 [Pseudomonas sp. CCOS 191]
MREDEGLKAPNEWRVIVKSIETMFSYDHSRISYLKIIGTDEDDKGFEIKVSSPMLQAGAWAAFNALKSNLSVRVELAVIDGDNELYMMSVT